MSAYESAGGSLNLKGVSDKSIKKKKKKSKSSERNKDLTKLMDNQKIIAEEALAMQKKHVKTKAELAYEMQNEKRKEAKILQKAELSHKEHVEKYNSHLDSLSEYNDIPKVSWTK